VVRRPIVNLPPSIKLVNTPNRTSAAAFLGYPGNFGTLNKLSAEYFPKDPPARSTPIAKLPLEELAISIEAIAVLSK
jgi:enamine deaminase RidA (YjgF/YER057c/UK114 family)